MKPIPENHPLRRLFRWATRQAADTVRLPRNADVESHISEGILARFVHIDNLYKIRNLRGRRLTDIADILLEADSGRVTGISDELLFHEYLGDYALFMTGIFPASLRRISRQTSSPDHLLMKLGSLFVSYEDPIDYYSAQGRAAYSKASRLFRPVSPRKARVFRHLAEGFPSYGALLGLIAAYLESDPYFRKARDIIA
jgi:hypothetical protein